MGLDMYLTKKTFIGAQYSSTKINVELAITSNNEPIRIDPKRISYIEEQVGYWRKANHIHKWFVDNCCNSEDNCQTVYVDEEKLMKLLSDCKKVKENPKLGPELLPTQEGPFFGSIEYDEDYMNDIDYTISVIKQLIIEKGTKDYMDFDIYYRASW